jgi:hypothetical protein
MERWHFFTDLSKRIKHSFWASELLITDGNDVSVWEFKLDIFVTRFFEFFHFFIEIKSNVAFFFFDSSNNLEFSRTLESLTGFHQDFGKMRSKISTSEVVSHNSMWKRITFIDWDSVGNSITRINDHTSGSSGGVEGKNSLDRDIELWDTESLEED